MRIRSRNHSCLHGCRDCLGRLFWWSDGSIARLEVGFSYPSSLPACVFFLCASPRRNRTFHSLLLRIDWFGCITLVSALVLLLVGLNSDGNPVTWSHPLLLLTISLPAVMTFEFVYIEYTWATKPILPLQLFAKRTVSAYASHSSSHKWLRLASFISYLSIHK